MKRLQLFFQFSMRIWLQPGLRPVWKDVDRKSASDGGPGTSIALIWTLLVKNPCLGWTSNTRTMCQGPGPGGRTTDHGPGARDQGPWTRHQGPCARDQGPGTGDDGPVTRDQDQGPGPGTRTRDQATSRLGIKPGQGPSRRGTKPVLSYLEDFVNFVPTILYQTLPHARSIFVGFFPRATNEGFLLCTSSAGAKLSFPGRLRPRCRCGAAAVPPYRN